MLSQTQGSERLPSFYERKNICVDIYPEEKIASKLKCFSLQKTLLWDFPGGPLVKNPPANAGDLGSIGHWSWKSPHAAEQLSPGATTTEACMPGAHALQQEKPLQ